MPPRGPPSGAPHAGHDVRSAEPVAAVGLCQISVRRDLSRWLDAREAALRLRSRAPREQSRVFQSASDASGEMGSVVRRLGAMI